MNWTQHKLPLPPLKWAQFVNRMDFCSRYVNGKLPTGVSNTLCARVILERMGYDIGTSDRVVRFLREQHQHELN
jgi:hypothetical protein